ncbi:hypothetical protein HNQ91_002036 [Filimonas zeae]|uniref:Uncharacterized protein n=1 Tax=Filimonas zeae TaxID=1737353 RepID=A0A917IVZ2_9BACT|nr:hypothetical protein [Filimonas zeae]MDR6338985.1 hypothetical protein [Filimonas zeae]GGH65657.1 hypothetical protein GCM10011379_19020 [Filimonas zeae]
MNKAKIALSITAAIAAIGGTLALKTGKTMGTRILLDQNRDGVCTSEAIGFKSTIYQQGYLYNYVTITAADFKLCNRAYYLSHP